MARILICHVPKDGSGARDLGAALMGRGHTVSFDGEPDTPRPDRAARLRQFDAVAVLWTETSAQSPGLADIAREAMPLNLLVPLRVEELAATRLPLAFRKLNMFTPRDVDGIARCVARLSTAASSLREMTERDTKRRAADAASAGQGPSPSASPRPSAGGSPEGGHRRRASDRPGADKPPLGTGVRRLSGLPEVEADPLDDLAWDERPAVRPAKGGPAAARDPLGARPGGDDAEASVVTADDLARAVDAGLLVHRIPEAMWLGAPTPVVLTLGREILAGLIPPQVGQGGRASAERQSIETLSVSLYGGGDAFEIERQSERTQVLDSRLAMSGRDPATFGRWAWLVTPCAAGAHDLVVRVTALLRDRTGVPAPVALPDRRFTIDVRVPEGASLVAGRAGWRRR